MDCGSDAEAVGDAECVGCAVSDADAVWLPVLEELKDVEGEVEGVIDGAAVLDEEAPGESDCEGVMGGVAVEEGDPVEDAVAEGEGVPVGEGVGVGVAGAPTRVTADK